ncbi:MAG TPA: tetratricopeptide repeat protein, partial [Candidatus Gastranaerophilaceae bacterium]|nr:tetratricopeptide repeat protein [Candidatus Gastranaerophilaceae bacterium]
IAMSYTQAGKQDKAIEAYSKVLALKPNPTLYEYATTGKMCLETPDKCKIGDDSGELEKMIRYNYGKGLSNAVRKDLEQKRLDVIKQEMNSDKEMDSYDLRKFKDYSNQRSKIEQPEKLSMTVEETNATLLQKSEQPKQPTNDEIVAALKVLNQAGLTNFANPMAQVNNPMLNAQSAEMAQMSMMLGGNNMQNNNNNNAMFNMLPFMMAQKPNGESSYTPQLMQAMIMNSMMPDFNYNLNENK